MEKKEPFPSSFFIRRVSPPCQYRLLRALREWTRNLRTCFDACRLFICKRERKREKFKLMGENEREYWTRIVWIHIYIYIYLYRFFFSFPLSFSLEKFMTSFGAIDRLIERFLLFEKCRRMCCTPFLSSLPLGSSFVYTRFRKRVQTDKCIKGEFLFFFFFSCIG